MDIVLKGRGVHVTDRMRRAAEHKLAKLRRLEPHLVWIEVEVFEEHNPRIRDRHRVKVACGTDRRIFRAEGVGDEVESALDQVVGHLERRMSDSRRRGRKRITTRGGSLKSP